MKDAPSLSEDTDEPAKAGAAGEAVQKPSRRLLSANTVRVLAINTVFGLLIGVAAYATSERTALFRILGLSGAGGIFGAAQPQAKGPVAKPAPLLGAANLAPDDPVLRFAQTRIGHMLFTSARSDNCQRVLFDNRTGVSFDVPGVFCGQIAEQVAAAQGPDRLEAVRSAFQR